MDFAKLYAGRRERVVAFMRDKGIAATVFEDGEWTRNPAVRYLSGHPSDAMLIVFAQGHCVLVPWDVNLATDKAFVDEVIPSEKFSRSNSKATREILVAAECKPGSSICLSQEIPYSSYKKFAKELDGWNLSVDSLSVHEFVKKMRAVKDEYEIRCIKRACAITDEMTEAIVAGLKNGSLQNEVAVALFIERELRLRGAQMTSFDTLAAGPERSFAIHAFPGYTSGCWGSRGLSILDYGVCYEGYASDCTITIAREISTEEEQLLDLVQQTADECYKLYMPGKKIKDAVKRAEEIFAKGGRKMPHGLGHGIGLEIHEEPFVSDRATDDAEFTMGNVITLEPGLYDKALGGVRLENDVLITESGGEILTHSEIFRL